MHYTEMYLYSQVEYWKQKVERVRQLCLNEDGFPVAVLAEDVLKIIDGEQ